MIEYNILNENIIEMLTVIYEREQNIVHIKWFENVIYLKLNLSQYKRKTLLWILKAQNKGNNILIKNEKKHVLIISEIRIIKSA